MTAPGARVRKGSAEVSSAVQPERVRRERFGPGEGITNPWPGDFILVRGDWWISGVIHGFQRLRFWNAQDRRYAYWSHVALVASPGGRIIEATEVGVIARHIEAYRRLDYHYVHIEASGRRRLQAVAFAESCIGAPYGRLSFLALGLSAMTGGRLSIGDRGQQLCGALVARALTLTGAAFERHAVDMMPADLAKHYGVVP